MVKSKILSSMNEKILEERLNDFLAEGHAIHSIHFNTVVTPVHHKTSPNGTVYNDSYSACDKVLVIYSDEKNRNILTS